MKNYLILICVVSSLSVSGVRAQNEDESITESYAESETEIPIMDYDQNDQDQIMDSDQINEEEESSLIEASQVLRLFETEEAEEESDIDNEVLNENAPKITKQPEMIETFNIGEPFVLECAARSDLPVEFSWTKNGRFLKANDPVAQIYSESLNNGNLLFISPKMRDVGTYQCMASSAAGKAFSRAILLVTKGTEVDEIIAENVESDETSEEIEAQTELPSTLDDNRAPRKDDDPNQVFVVLPMDEDKDLDIIKSDNFGGDDEEERESEEDEEEEEEEMDEEESDNEEIEATTLKMEDL